MHSKAPSKSSRSTGALSRLTLRSTPKLPIASPPSRVKPSPSKIPSDFHPEAADWADLRNLSKALGVSPSKAVDARQVEEKESKTGMTGRLSGAEASIDAAQARQARRSADENNRRLAEQAARISALEDEVRMLKSALNSAKQEAQACAVRKDAAHEIAVRLWCFFSVFVAFVALSSVSTLANAPVLWHRFWSLSGNIRQSWHHCIIDMLTLGVPLHLRPRPQTPT